MRITQRLFKRLADRKLIKENRDYYDYWKQVQRGDQPLIRKGAGFYLNLGMLFSDNKKGKVEEWEMESGEIAKVKLIDYEACSDPKDMVKESWWLVLGYKGKTPLKETTFRQFMDEYAGLLVKRDE